MDEADVAQQLQQAIIITFTLFNRKKDLSVWKEGVSSVTMSGFYLGSILLSRVHRELLQVLERDKAAYQW